MAVLPVGLGGGGDERMVGAGRPSVYAWQCQWFDECDMRWTERGEVHYMQARGHFFTHSAGIALPLIVKWVSPSSDRAHPA